MHSEERKELRENSLVRWLKHLKEGPSRTTLIWMVILVVGLAGWLSYRYVRNSSRQESSTRAKTLYEAGANDAAAQQEALNKFIQGNAETNYALYAQLSLARMELQDGLTGLYDSKDTKAKKTLESAVKKLTALKDSFSDDPYITQQCMLLAAKGNEGLGKYNEANQLYADIQSRFGDSETAKVAKARLDYNKKNAADLEALSKKLIADKS